MATKVKPFATTNPAQTDKAVGESERLPHLVSEQEIRERAYEIYLQRGAQAGHEQEDWLQAERELSNSNVTHKS
jgi:hypothetical protein